MTPVPPIPAELWDQIPPAARAAVRALVQSSEQQLAVLRHRLEDLEQRLGQNSTNSSRPPSSDPPTVKRAPPRPPSGRRSGGQPGHALHQRPLLEPTRPPVALNPAACRQCGQALTGTDPRPLRHQVLELPACRPDVTEYRLRCAHCGRTTCAALPAGVPAGGQGPRLQAAVALLTGAYRLSKRQAEGLCADLLGTPVSAGQVCAVEADAVAAMAPAVAALRGYVQGRPANVDETGWWQQGRRAWLWSVVTHGVTVFVLALSRAAAVAQDLIDPSAGQVITTDRYKGYDWLPLYQRQLCWAHTIRTQSLNGLLDRYSRWPRSLAGAFRRSWGKSLGPQPA
jgi:transposase